MAILSLILAGLVGAAVVNSSNPPANSRSNDNQHYNKSDESQRLSTFLSLYNRLNNMVKYDFNTSKNGLKSFADTIRSIGAYSGDQFSCNEFSSFLYKVVRFRNESIGHNEAGIGAYPSDDLIRKLRSLCDYYYNNRSELCREFKRIEHLRLGDRKRIPY